jgi:AcrR family transcriptional regulator
MRTVASTRAVSIRVSEMQRARMLVSAAQVLAEHGYAQMSVARVTHGARVSRRTFYDVFEDREDCFLAVFDEALARASERALDAHRAAGDRDWCELVRAGFQALLTFFDEEPRLARLLVVDALQAGPRVLARRAEILASVSTAIQDGGAGAHRGREPLPRLTGEGVVGGVLGVIHTRLSPQRPGTLLELLNPLMATIVLPYLGPVAARRELQRSAPKPVRGRARSRAANGVFGSSSLGSNLLVDLPMRLTYRTMRVLGAIAEQPGSSNREIGDAAGASDQGQISKLLTRLERLDLIENTTGQGHQPTGEPNAWRLTSLGEEVRRVTRIGSADRHQSEVA